MEDSEPKVIMDDSEPSLSDLSPVFIVAMIVVLAIVVWIFALIFDVRDWLNSPPDLNTTTDFIWHNFISIVGLFLKI